jgi:hypothetical protein
MDAMKGATVRKLAMTGFAAGVLTVLLVYFALR